ncbi:beta-galactosidase [Nakamurella lactea]|uniref:beta-galactosidase n=1 Tax=Nakamurella lactea TaxID=459515 RepID=UPI0003F7D148|nr:beta-galactosidase [Nakamurella lactea]
MPSVRFTPARSNPHPDARRRFGRRRWSVGTAMAGAALIGAALVTPAQAAPAAQPVSAVAPAAVVAAPAGGLAPNSTSRTHTVTFDKYSLQLDGKPTYIWSGEFHYFRLPSPDLWRDVLQKMKAEGYNAVSLYFDWAYHSPKPGVYDFSGVRDIDRLLDIAEETGLYVIARPGPYINAEVSGGGFPGWLSTVDGKGRSNDASYVAAADQWLTAVDRIIARHQYTKGQGSVILYQIENELAATGSSQRDYMQHLYDKVRSDDITVPIFHNDKGRNGIWVPTGSDVPGTVEGPTDLYAFDGYPGGACRTDGTTGSPATAPDWGIWGSGGANGGSTASPDTPGFAAEFGGGWFDYWGSNGTYQCTAEREGPGYERVFYGTNIANRISIQNIYMGFGGTSWGWQPAPVVFSSYDYGAGIDEARQLRPKVTTMKQLGLFVQSVNPITKIDKAAMVTPSSPAIKVYDDVNPDTGTHFYIAMHNPSSATTDESFTFPIATADGTYTVPQQGSLRIDGQTSKILVADYDLDGASGPHLVYSTSQIMTHLRQGASQLALLYAPPGDDGETVLRYSQEPNVQVLSGTVASSYDAATGDLRLNYVHDSLAQVRITGGGRTPLTLLLADEHTAGTFWQQTTPAGTVLERGPELVRSATIARQTLALTGDTSTAAELQVWAPPGVDRVTWNGTRVAVHRAADGSLVADQLLPGAAPIALPDLTAATWRSAPGSPESAPGFDDSQWQPADRTTTASTTKPAAGQPVLTADDYGFHSGDVWYRGRYTATAAATSITLRYGGGGAGMLQAWLDGVYLGQDVLGTGVSSPPTSGTVTFAVPNGLRTDGQHQLSVMVRNDGHNEDGGVNDAYKEGRGLISMTMADATGAIVQPTASWRIQGNRGGQDLADPVRGAMNASGSYGDRAGWFLPGYPDGSWAEADLPAAAATPGTTWYRTSFQLHTPAVDDASLGITIGDPTTPRSTGDYRALIYVNGWNIGQYIANVGPQHTFVVPNGILDPNGRNTLAIEVTSAGGVGNGLESVALVDLGTVRGGVDVRQNRAPSWNAHTWGVPARVSNVAVDPVRLEQDGTVAGGDTVTVDSAIRNQSPRPVSAVNASVDLPDGWTATPVSSAPATLAPGASAAVSWTVTVPEDIAAGKFPITVLAGYRLDGHSSTTGASTTVSVRPFGELFVSDLEWSGSTNGYGPVERDQNVGGTGEGDGQPLSINGVGYSKGLGTNAVSTVTLDLAGKCTSFAGDVGLDDSAGSKGSVTFAVVGDGTTLASTPVMRGGQPAQQLTADLTGLQTLVLQVGDAGDGVGHDNADWGDARIVCTR